MEEILCFYFYLHHNFIEMKATGQEVETDRTFHIVFVIYVDGVEAVLFLVIVAIVMLSI